MYLQYTPSSKRNLSSKILHKSPPIYFLTLTKNPEEKSPGAVEYMSDAELTALKVRAAAIVRTRLSL